MSSLLQTPASTRSWFNAPWWTEWCGWVGAGVAVAGLAGAAQRTGGVGALDAAIALAAGLAVFAVAVTLRRILVGVLPARVRSGLKFATWALTAFLVSSGGVQVLGIGSSESEVSDADLAAMVTAVRTEAVPDAALLDRVARRGLAPQQAQLLARTARDTPTARALSALSATQREDVLLRTLQERVPTVAVDLDAARAAARQVCTAPADPATAAAVRALGGGADELTAGTFHGLAIRALCPERLVESMLAR